MYAVNRENLSVPTSQHNLCKDQLQPTCLCQKTMPPTHFALPTRGLDLYRTLLLRAVYYYINFFCNHTFYYGALMLYICHSSYRTIFSLIISVCAILMTLDADLPVLLQSRIISTAGLHGTVQSGYRTEQECEM